ncbi:BamA/TamA family outer membrane protein [Microbulbifer thermotolerans]|uniref:autotransporter assembly complex protein TamA n=1 Tax=Microbulbifer thermotolerans TaxID=252514 RepID=UPI002673B922|nr:BamA/TamA family outer membrane protein [Microbulbifer thermotolerans]WKT59337.1 BamA/TamA family outer membrane protein [Microbulbifer thermotolerans]
MFIPLLLSGLLLSTALPALAIPFLDQLPGFKLRVQGDRELQEQLRDELEKLRKSDSTLKSYKDPREVARYERGTLEKLLRSLGYYDAWVRQAVSDGDILYRVKPGPRYRIKSLSVTMPESLREGLGGLPLEVGDPLVAEKVLAGVNRIKQYLADNACLLEIDVSYKATVIHSEAAARLEYRVAPSPDVRVGEVYLEGLTSVEPAYLRDKLQLNSGDCFNRGKIDAARLRLLRTNLISSANTRVSEPYGGLVDITFTLQERHHRTVSLGVGYTSDEGAGFSAGWEHRNILRRGEKIEVEAKVNPVQQTLKGELLAPRFFSREQNLSASAELSNEDRDSYQAKAITLGATVARKLSKHRTASIGAELKFSEVEESEELASAEDDSSDENYQLLSFPLGMKWDTTDKLLDARRGATVALEVRPYVDLGNTSTTFIKNTLVLTGYKTAETLRYQPTLALRIKAGVISGIDNLDIPADERFYAGGGGSVRGYAYQALGPRLVVSSDGETSLSDPIGGRALSELSIEGRFRFSKSWGGVLFLDSGNAYADPRPDFSDLYWGAGFGVRYNTSFAPLRFDIAFPLDKREDIDDDFQVYVSLGQAF